MSRMTSAQVIELGEYLEPDFDPSKLTVSQLLGVLGYHNVAYPTPYSKPKLVQLFNDEIKAKSVKLKKERLKRQNSIASDEGIKDGITGQPLGTARRNAPVTRRSSRRLSKAPIQDEEEDASPIRAELPKRRRSSAQPSLGRPSRKSSTAITQPTLAEESEPEEDEFPLRKLGKSDSTSDTAGAHTRRVSQTTNDDSGWEDNNIFQSGAESSSPARPSPVKPKSGRKSVVSRKSRKSSSAPPQTSPLRSSRTEGPEFPSQFPFQPELPALLPKQASRLASPEVKAGSSDIDWENPIREECGTQDESAQRAESRHLVEPIKEEVEEDQVVSESETRFVGAEGSEEGPVETAVASAVVVREAPLRSRISSVAFRMACIALCFAALNTLVGYKMESASIGYCDTGSHTNTALEALRARRHAIEMCNKENRTLLYLPQSTDSGLDQAATPCPLLPLLPFPQPDACTPCPDHATCSQHIVTCETGYLLQPHPLFFYLPAASSPHLTSLKNSSSPSELAWKLISDAFDGLPGAGSVAFPPHCTEDPKRKRNIGVLGKAIESVLGQERGRRICAGGKTLEEKIDDMEGGEAKKWGIDMDELKGIMKKKTPAHLLATFDDTFTEAIQQLIQWGGVIFGEDRQHRRYVAHKTPDLTWDCVVTIKSRELWKEWKTTVFGLIAVIAAAMYSKARRAQRLVEARRVTELVQIALDTLRNQELAHYTDPVTAPQPYLSSLQLRDLILQDEHSVSSRTRLWTQVERVVEGNANVRVNLVETQGGDEMRVWRWIGAGVIRQKEGEK